MSQENVEIVRQVVEANRSDDLVEARIEADIVALWDPSCEWTRVTAAVDPQIYRGHDGLRRYFSDMADSWAEWRNELEEVFEVGTDTVVAVVRSRLTGKASGVPIEAGLAVVFVLSQGKVLRGQAYPSRQEALEAVGLSE
ncbi:MAG: nuclear transport factor 2 family protein [Thermoleophilaceae bacterium]|nr:nuclear transport factor 2 family protein [Thermoleophilaceae bacterium]